MDITLYGKGVIKLWVGPKCNHMYFVRQERGSFETDAKRHRKGGGAMRPWKQEVGVMQPQTKECKKQ